MKSIEQKRKIIVAIDGPAASGKSTTARKVSGMLGYTYIDTGAMFRCVTLKAAREGLLEKVHREPVVIEPLLSSLTIEFDRDRVFLDGSDVTDAIRDNGVSREVSFISSLKPVRDRLKEMQRRMGDERGVVMDGRDIGTVVFPDAELKIFLVADPAERARRRYAELESKHGAEGLPSLDELEQEIIQRDRDDRERTHAPLRKHEDAVELDTSALSIEEQVDMVYRLAMERISA
ncbi:(d)CMP kinase [Prosthecochloris sp. CIB 2401]|uniref:(d)CMP kinase n=1 Tax=Prosthecochloris sp. CIB 2401 TaxID=1868325 RepID=UPI00080AAA7B|nr:(d)CMP kinase [Prosthecochloris sp. CIB 2401]ANT65624.1 Cytidylate kinase [Prosthecochloris sp. CIB 2401]